MPSTHALKSEPVFAPPSSFKVVCSEIYFQFIHLLFFLPQPALDKHAHLDDSSSISLGVGTVSPQCSVAGRVWSMTKCPGGYLTLSGDGSQASQPECSAATSTFPVRCCAVSRVPSLSTHTTHNTHTHTQHTTHNTHTHTHNTHTYIHTHNTLSPTPLLSSSRSPPLSPFFFLFSQKTNYFSGGQPTRLAS